MGEMRGGVFFLRMRFGSRVGLALPRSASKEQTVHDVSRAEVLAARAWGLGRFARPKTDGTGETPSTRRADISASGSRPGPRARAFLRRSESRRHGRRRTTTRAAASNPLRGRRLHQHERSRPTINSIPRRVDGATFIVLKSFHSLVDVVRGDPLRPSSDVWKVKKASAAVRFTGARDCRTNNASRASAGEKIT